MIGHWDPAITYNTGDQVLHKSKVYQKSADTDQTEPDDVAGGWDEVQGDNLAEFAAIAESFSSYEQRVADHKAAVLRQLTAAGLNPDVVRAVLVEY